MPGPGRVLVAVPCLNEAVTIAKVVADFRRSLPGAEVVVFDNGSTDGSAALARAAGARVETVTGPGKGRVVQAIFERVDADAVVLADADDTYPAEVAARLVEPVLRGEADMAIGSRLRGKGDGLSPVRRLGNRLVVAVFNLLFGTRLADVLSGYRAIGRELRDSVQLEASGFEVETELTARALAAGARIVEIPVGYRERPPGSRSKLVPGRDGWRILRTAVRLRCRHFRASAGGAAAPRRGRRQPTAR